MDIEVALTKTGYGKFHYRLLTVCAISLLSVGLQGNLSSYIFSAVQCELNLTSFELGILNVAFLFGGSLSCFLWGIIADNFGRKPVLIIAHLINIIITIVTALFRNVTLLILGRFLTGFFISAPATIIYSYLAEFQPIKYRPLILSILNLFFTLAYLLLPLLSWLILPININWNLSMIHLQITPWRLLLIVIGLPEIIVGWALFYLPETPVYYLNQGNIQKSLTILKLIFSTNTNQHIERFPVKNLLNCRKNQIEIDNSDHWKITRISQRIYQQFKQLFQPPLLLVTVLSCAVSFCSLFGLYGLGLWLPEFFVRFELYENLYPNSTVTIKQLTQLKITSTATMGDCKSSLDNSVIFNTTIVGAISLLCSIIATGFVQKVDLKLIVLLSLLLGSLSTFLIYFLNTSLQNLIISSIFQSTMIIGNVTIGSLVTNLFPSDIIGICLSLVIFCGRFGAIISNLVFGYLMDDYCEIPIIIVAICLLIGSVLCYFIPKNNNNNIKNCNNNNDTVREKSIEIAVIRS